MKRTNTAKWIESSGRWQINVQKDGIRKTFVSSKPGRTGQAEANRKADQWFDDGIANTKIKVNQASEQYINLKISTSQSHWLQDELEIQSEYVFCDKWGTRSEAVIIISGGIFIVIITICRSLHLMNCGTPLYRQ